MAYDRIYYFDKINHRRYELGEIQTNFNLNIVIDGDKDSMQIDVHSYSREALQPNTIIYHANDPLQWFVVKKDNVKRNANEKGFYYIHSITLNGAIDLLKNRDLTDCGFNANGYTIDDFFKKLLKLSNFEFDYEIDYGNNVDKDKKVDYIKSYENYTLLSAIRDFFNGYNCDVKLGFETITQGGYVVINKAIFKIIPRTGNIDLSPIDISEFNDIRESINFDKESYGTTVISNAQNVVSTLAKTFPQVGGVRVTGNDYNTTWQSAYIKLPSPVWKVNWVKLICPLRIQLIHRTSIGLTTAHISNRQYTYDEAFKSLIQNASPNISQTVIEKMEEQRDRFEALFNKMTITFYNNPSYNPRVDLNGTYGTIIKEEQTPYIAFMDHITSTGTSDDAHQVAVMDKESSELLKSDKLALVFERGSDKITNLIPIEDMSNKYVENCDLLGGSNKIENFYIEYGEGGLWDAYDLEVFWGDRGGTKLLQQVIPHETCFQVNYIPMSDLKVKQDNENNNNDIQLYNQNGKLNDSVALSKMVDSYSKEIEHPTITRYGEYYNINDIPQIGQIVMDGNIKYVINNISYNLYPCESDDEDEVNYYCECEFTLAEFISTKSIMTSPNTNVRDYGIPQKYNIKRRQVYRDYYEFAFVEDELANLDTPYTDINNYLEFDSLANEHKYDHTALIKITYESEIGEPLSDTWYYQLNSTAYTMAKSVYEVIDFDDNNIIGYDIANSTTGFDMSNLWDSRYRAVTTPVQYVDDFGKFVGITLKMTGREALEQAYSQIDTDNNTVMFSAHCFIPQEIYDLVAQTPTPTDSNEVYEEAYYRVTEIQQTYSTSITINADDIGIPLDLELTNENILGLTNVAVIDNGNTLNPRNYSLSITQLSGRNITITFSTSTSTFVQDRGTLEFYFYVQYMLYNSTADYTIDEPNYEKDPIEVPVFEYSLQIGDTSDVTVGDNILNYEQGICVTHSFIATDNEITMLNASAYRNNVGINVRGGELIGDKRTFIVQNNFGQTVTLAFAENNKKLKLHFYNSGNQLYFETNTDQEVFSLTNEINPAAHTAPFNLINKNIIVFRNTIKSIKHDDNADTNVVEYDSEPIIIIHRPPQGQWNSNIDLVLDVNYYKLK